MSPKSRREDTIRAMGFDPAPGHTLLLRVALAADDDVARDSWKSWRSRGGDLESAGEGTRRLLPALLRRLASLVPGDPELARVRGLHRRALYWFSLMASRVVPVIEALEAHGIPVMVIKGAGLVPRYIPDAGARPMGDVDLAVPRTRAAEAVAILEAQVGWTPRAPGTGSQAIACQHARDHGHQLGFGLDLHWNLLLEASYPGADDPFWEAAVPVRWQGRTVLGLCPTDALFHTLVQDAGHDRPPSPHWILDARAVLARDSDHIDWDRLVMLARRFHLVMGVEAALRVLRDLDQTVPDLTLEALAGTPIPTADHLYHELRRRPRGGAAAPVRVLASYWFRRGRGLGPVRALIELPAYLRAMTAMSPAGSFGRQLSLWSDRTARSTGADPARET